MNKKLLLSILLVGSFTHINASNSLQKELDALDAQIEAVYANVLKGYRRSLERQHKPKASKPVVKFTEQPPEIQTLPQHSIMDLILKHGFTRNHDQMYSSIGLEFLKGKPNVFPELLNLLKQGHNLHVLTIRRGLKNIPKKEIIQSLESYLRCNRNIKFENLLRILKQGNYYEI